MPTLPDTNDLTIDGARLWRTIHELATIGETAKGGVCRLAFTAEDRAGRDQFIRWCREIGLKVERDRIGNIFALMEGRDPHRPSVMVGSHLDSQPTGGKYDGAYGVMSGLEIARMLHDRGLKPLRNLELVSWANEEGARFSPPLMGSGVFAGRFQFESMIQIADSDGITIADALARDPTGALPNRVDRKIGWYLEGHIEQGPVLEHEEIPIGVVTGAQAQRWFDATITGSESHAGPTPMELRHDAFMAAAALALAVEGVALQHAPDGRGTVGQIKISPGSRNVVPGRATMTIDLRHPDDGTIARMEDALRGRVAALAQERRVDIDVQPFWQTPVVPFDEQLMGSIEAAARSRGLATRRIASGAGHDAVYLAGSGVPTAMVFVPTKDGLSHNELESMSEIDAIQGCQILSDVVVERLFMP